MTPITIRKNVATKSDSDLVNEIQVSDTDSNMTIGEDDKSIGGEVSQRY